MMILQFELFMRLYYPLEFGSTNTSAVLFGEIYVLTSLINPC